jgi:hypothetical protein
MPSYEESAIMRAIGADSNAWGTMGILPELKRLAMYSCLRLNTEVTMMT